VWIPGSYLVREFARHVSGVAAEQGGRTVPIRQLGKASWLAPCEGEADLVVRHRVCAFDELVDHPVELGRFWRGRLEAAGVAHEFVVAGALPDFDDLTVPKATFKAVRWVRASMASSSAR
jgi:predicted metalloprotease with PDZ domain